MNPASPVLITALVVVLAIVLTFMISRQVFQARLLVTGAKLGRLEDASEKAGRLESEVRELLAFRTLAQERSAALEAAKAEVARVQAELTRAIAENSSLRTQLEKEREALEKTFARMEADFQNLARKVFDESSLKFTERSKESMKAVLDPLGHDLGEFKKRLDATYVEETKQRSTLQEQVRMLADLNQKISKDAENLTKALKGESKTQGTWGEMVLEKVLESSGLRKDEEYVLQKSLTGADGKRLQPDVVVHLPEKRDVIIDSKVSLVAYEAFCSSETDEDRVLAAESLASSIRTHIKGLSAKAYQNIKEIDSIDIAVMFIANEGALSIAAMRDRALLEDAVRQNVMLATPTSLLAVLKGIEYGWRSERQSRNVQQIFKAAGDLYDKFTAFALDMQELGKRLDQANQSYDSAKGKLVGGRGNLTGQAERLRELGAKNSKSLPAGWEGADS
ncbi:MAG TPA: DNA recombination protein RmuC, partial [Magnetospirillaceae bacterium]|nr:DNA recombination protein RmuC [Magnetospirillaceae bacterium]